MPSYADIYVLSKERNIESYKKFLSDFLRKSEESSDEYPLPQYADEPTSEVNSAIDTLELSIKNKELEYNLYWHDAEENNLHASIFLLKDSHVIYGIATPDEDIETVLSYKNKLEKHFPGCLCYIGHECSDTPDSMEMFIEEKDKHKEINFEYYGEFGSK